MIKVDIIALLEDNYSFYLEDSKSGINAVIDPAEADGIYEYLQKSGINKLNYIINTHHHWDHVGGNKKLKRIYGAKVIGAKADKNRIPEIDIQVKENDKIDFGSEHAVIIETHGHTLGHVSVYFPHSNIIFVGDSLFSMGCGRLFEGTAQEMFDSLQKIKKLPDDCLIYCAHEYTLENGEFARNILPHNDDITKYIDKVSDLRNKNIPTIPVSLEQEKKVNIFLMAKNAKEFAEYRKKRDNW